MLSAIDAAADLAAPGAGPITSKEDVGRCAYACAQLCLVRAGGGIVPDADVGDAVCEVYKAANLLERGSTNSPGELGAKVDNVSADVGALKADVGTLKADMVTVKDKLEALNSLMVGVKAGLDNVVHRNVNGISRMLEHNLEPLMAEAGEYVGKYPTQSGLFPATLAALFSLNNSQLDNLEKFYAREFKGNSMAARHNAFSAFIGALSARP